MLFLSPVIVGILIYVGVVLYIEVNSGNVVVRTGTAYGVSIDSGKYETYQVLLERYSDERIHVTGGYFHGITEAFDFHATNAFELLTKFDTWELNFSEGRANYLRLTFEDGRLVKIERIWRPFNFP